MIGPIAPPRKYDTLTPSMLAELTSAYGKPADGPDEIAALIAPFGLLDREAFLVVSLDAKNKVLSIEVVHLGCLSKTIVGTREVFRAALRANASSIIVAHNHPSGDPTPSPEDIEVTKSMVDAGIMLDIPVIDHLILVDSDFTSLKRRGVM